MKRLITLCLIVAATSIFALGQQDNSENPRSIAAAVKSFNERAKSDSVGQTQPPLTRAEVIAAIRGWIPENTPGVSDEIYEKFQQIAESGQLPEGAELTFTTGWEGYRGFRFDVWWVDLNIKTGEKSGYTFRIRDQKISSQKWDFSVR